MHFGESVSEDLLEHVCILQGTDSRHSLSYGNTLPLVAHPWGMHHWTLQTDTGNWLFNAGEPLIQGIRLTHQPSPWIGDYAALCIMPQLGPLQLGVRERASSYRVNDSTLRPDHLSVRLLRYRCQTSLAPSMRGAVIRFEFETDQVPRVIIEAPAGRFDARQSGTHVIDGFTTGNSGGVPDNFAMHYIADFDKPIAKFERVDNSFYVEFARGTQRVELRLAGSFISVHQARVTVNSELIGRSFEGIRALARTTWLAHLERFRLDGCTPEQRRTFYSCLYRTLLFPRTFSEIDDAGNELHYSPYDGKVHAGPMYTDTGFWDTHRTLFPWLNWMFPETSGRMVSAFLNAYRQGGWLPQWMSPGYRACMVGTHSDAVLADAVIKNVGGFDAKLALEAMLKHATQECDSAKGHGRAGVRAIDELSYLPADEFHQSVSTTLDYAYDDWCIAQVAAAVGQVDLADRFIGRSARWRALFDAVSGFMRGRRRDGSWVEPFSQYTWGGPYVEGGPWQSSWAVPHDAIGLMRVLGGPEATIAKLDAMLSAPPGFDVGTYPFEIHEMTEMALADFGQYAHSNQPVHNVLWLYPLAGAPEKNQRAVHRVLNELYNAGPRGFPGDEDNGEMSAWFIFAALGLYPSCPGSAIYTLGLPWVPRITLEKPDGQLLSINTDQRLLSSTGTRVIRRIDGQLHRAVTLSHEQLTQANRIDVVPA